MALTSEVYDLTQNLQGAVIFGANSWQKQQDNQDKVLTPPDNATLRVRAGLAAGPGWMLVQVEEFHPEPLTVEKFRVRAVYSAPRISQAVLELLAVEGWLDRRGDEYHATEAGLELIRSRNALRQAVFEGFEPIPLKEIERTHDLMERVMQASMAASDSPGTWCLGYSRKRKPADDAPALYKIFHHGTDFNAFRDDAHMAAFRPYDVPGHTWEVFGFIHDGQAANLDDIHAQLARRGFSRDEWAESLDDLSARGWLAADGASYSATDAGKAVRSQAEQLTDEYFYAPWRAALSEAEIEELQGLMTRLHDACQTYIEQ